MNTLSVNLYCIQAVTDSLSHVGAICSVYGQLKATFLTQITSQ